MSRMRSKHEYIKSIMLVNSSIVNEIKSIIAGAKERIIRAVDHGRVLTDWHIGKVIFEEELQVKKRADHGTYLIKYLSEQLQLKFEYRFSIRQLELCWQLYRTFPIAQSVS